MFEVGDLVTCKYEYHDRYRITNDFSMGVVVKCMSSNKICIKFLKRKDGLFKDHIGEIFEVCSDYFELIN